MWEQFIIIAAVSAIRAAVKSPAHKAALREYMLEIVQAIQTAFADDPAFNPAAKG